MPRETLWLLAAAAEDWKRWPVAGDRENIAELPIKRAAAVCFPIVNGEMKKQEEPFEVSRRT
jgi:hypothetical protein